MFAGRAHINLVRRLQPELGISNEVFDIRSSSGFLTRNMVSEIAPVAAHANIVTRTSLGTGPKL